MTVVLLYVIIILCDLNINPCFLQDYFNSCTVTLIDVIFCTFLVQRIGAVFLLENALYKNKIYYYYYLP